MCSIYATDDYAHVRIAPLSGNLIAGCQKTCQNHLNHGPVKYQFDLIYAGIRTVY
jgi:hypothetical protein